MKKQFKEVNEATEELHVKVRIHDLLFMDSDILPEDYVHLIRGYQFYNTSLVKYLHSEDLKLTPYEIFLCIFSFERIPLRQVATLLGKNEVALKKAHQRIKEKLKIERNFHYLSDYFRSRF